jgi:nicotinate-nucleotide--dimethylbenzimidazole phosphoribosyltransferase
MEGYTMNKWRETAVKPIDPSFFDIAQKRLDNLTKPPSSLGRLEEFARRLVAIQKNERPRIDKKIVFVFAGDHGVTDDGVSAFPKEVTSQMVFNFLAGGAAINVLTRHAGAEVVVVDVGVDFDFTGVEGLIHRKIVRGTKSFVRASAMSREEAIRCLEVGIDLAHAYADKGFNLFGTGDMGIGNTTPSSAIAAVITDRPPAAVTGRGTGITDEGLATKIRVIEEGIRYNKPDRGNGLDVLSKVGGAEIGGIAGLIIGAAERGVPVVIDGLISTAGALIAYTIEPKVKDYMFAGHSSVEIGHRAMLDAIGLQPILDLDLRLGEGTGAALAMLLIEGGLKIYNEMATFDEAGVSDGKEE